MTKPTRRATPRRIGNSKLVQGGRVLLPDGEGGYIQRVITPTQTKSRRAIVIGDNGQSYNVRASEITPVAGRPTERSVKTTTTGKLPENVARGLAPDAKGNVRAPMPKNVINKLIALGKIQTGGGGGGGAPEPSFGPDLLDPTSEKPDRFKYGGLVKRKSSFKGTF